MTPTPMPFEDVLTSSFWIGLKLLYILVFIFFTIFALMVVKQIKLMSKTILGPSDKWLTVFSYIYLSICLFFFILALIVL